LLDPAAGARALLREYATPFPLPEGAVDIDTPEDFATLAISEELKNNS
jgi:hypothetical protein